MQEISEKKRNFLNVLGIDINNLPPEFEKHNDSMEDMLSREEIDFLEIERLTGIYNKRFHLKDLVGTTHPSYANKTWIEAFLLSKRGDEAIEQYFRNPDYYSIGLKQQEQSNLSHDSPIQLYESNGRFFIKGGNNRLLLIMMKYLAEMSRAKKEEEKSKIDEEYTFVAEVQPIPKDKDIIYIIDMIRKNYGDRALIQRTADNADDCQYTVKIGEETIIIKSKEELEQLLRDSYRVDRLENLDELRRNIESLIQDRIIYGVKMDQNRGIILESIFPNLQQFQESFMKLKEYGVADKLFEGIDLHNLSFTELSNKAIEMARNEEKRIGEEKQAEGERKSEQRKEDISVRVRKQHIEQQITSIVDRLETTYYELKQAENKFFKLARKLGLNYSMNKTDDTNIHTSIQQIKSNMQRILEQIQKIDDPMKLDEVSKMLNELDALLQDGTINTIYIRELKEILERSFDMKVQELIRNSKVSRLEQEKESVDSEKISIMGRLLGRGKLKQAKLDNIDLKIRFLMLENRKG